MVDVKDDFTIDPDKIKAAINEHTKVILPVDIGGYPCDYDAIRAVLDDPEVKACTGLPPGGNSNWAG